MRVAVLGLGRMGTAIAVRLAEHGHELSVWNRTPGRAEELRSHGARALASPARAFEHADVCLTMLSDGDALEAVVAGDDGVLAGTCSAASVLVDMSTVSPASSARVAAAADRRGVAFLRAPVSGNPSVVAAGNLGIIVSGPRDAYDRLESLLYDIGPNLFHVGLGEQARIVKLALNLMLGGTAELMAEALVLAECHGIERRDMLEVMGSSAIGSPFVRYKTEALIADDYRSTFSSRLMRKDFELALAAAREVELPLPVTALTAQLVQGAIAIGLGDDDFSALLPRLRHEAGLDRATAPAAEVNRTG